MIYYFGDQAVPGSFGARGGPSPFREWPSLMKQIQQEAQRLKVGAHGMTPAQHQAMYGAVLVPLTLPAALANNASTAAVSQHTIATKQFHEEQEALLQIMHDILRILDSGYHAIITETDANGNDLGILRRTLPNILHLLNAFFGATDRQALIEEKEELLVPYNYELHGTYDQFLNKVLKSTNYLRKHNSSPSEFEMYDIAKVHVQGVPLLHEAVAIFEYLKPLPVEQTYAALTAHLSNVAKANPQKLTAHHVINQATNSSSKAGASNFSTMVADEIIRALGSRTLSSAAQKRILSRLNKDIQQELTPKPPKSCAHHPLSKSHSTEECRNPK